MSEIVEINRYITNCPECMEKGQNKIYLRENFEEVMEVFDLDVFETLQVEKHLEEVSD